MLFESVLLDESDNSSGPAQIPSLKMELISLWKMHLICSHKLKLKNPNLASTDLIRSMIYTDHNHTIVGQFC